ncbi:RagB/SusD family nutrient uptake outer membrane protein [Tannerella forsythia]|uniref:RagB/SusD family nutrient uptake outer membrane protein n=1 Tax=Tannerella forsythia TaxID=28112 RepID=UPI0028EC5416|nr:RagB/SusD family nutrient uptake outer membrane protein [Tannerella forsythia]
MKKIKNISILIGLAIPLLFWSCTDYLNVSDELAGELTMPEVFENSAMTRRFHRYIYTGIPDMSNIIMNSSYSGITGLDNPWVSISDELKAAQNNVRTIAITGYNAGNAGLGRWGLYKQIRQANLFMQHAKEIPQQGETDYISATELASLKAEARFLRAYFHYLLFELYGPIPIVREAIDPQSADLDYARNTVDEVITFLDKEITEVAPLLKEEEPKERRAVPTRGAALALKAKMWMYAASPLLNGGYTEALNLEDKEGKKLFPPYDASKWQKALNALQEFIDYAQKKYELYKIYNSDGVLNADESLYQLFQKSENNKEIIWASTKNSWGSVNGEGRERRCTPRNVFQGFACVGIVQEMIDDFFMQDGLGIKESPLYKEDGYDTDFISNMYRNREPRFYQAVMYSGRPWHVNNKRIYFHKGSGNDNSKADNPYTGYLLYKGLTKTLLNQGTNPKSQYKPTILFRLADFYLLYAEALNEVNPSDPRIVEYIDKVRQRAGIPLLADIKPQIKGNKELQREAIIRERRVELFAEGQRYFDVRRWMIADQPLGRQGGDFHGMDMNAETAADFLKRVTFETRVFEKRMYLYPLPLDEVQKSKKLVQNPDW